MDFLLSLGRSLWSSDRIWHMVGCCVMLMHAKYGFYPHFPPLGPVIKPPSSTGCAIFPTLYLDNVLKHGVTFTCLSFKCFGNTSFPQVVHFSSKFQAVSNRSLLYIHSGWHNTWLTRSVGGSSKRCSNQLGGLPSFCSPLPCLDFQHTLQPAVGAYSMLLFPSQKPQTCSRPAISHLQELIRLRAHTEGGDL